MVSAYSIPPGNPKRQPHVTPSLVNLIAISALWEAVIVQSFTELLQLPLSLYTCNVYPQDAY